MNAHARLGLLLSFVGLAAVAACGGGEPATADSAAAPATPAVAPAGGPQTPDAGGKVIAVNMVTDDQGNNVFIPADFSASKGDVIRFTLVQGVHNAHFLPDSNPGAVGLPPATDLLQLPGQTSDVKVTWGPGHYFYQCDPHALLGMVGHLTVQ
ncbi:MAG: plastocyanin/azurin family copper-binding protein [Gemmatimonadaceae bacterium]